ncbi:MAG: PAS domain S-box protein, partial [Luteibaculum sp.]
TEFRIIREGKIRWIKAHGTVLRDQELNPTRMVGLNYDITEEKNKAIEQQEAHLKTEGILRSITDGFISMDEEFRINYWNAAAEKILGMERTKVLGKTIQSVFKEFEGSKTHKEFHLAQTKQELREFEAYYPNIGSWAMVSVYPKASGITVYFKDITKERKKIKELQQLKNLQNHVINSTQDLIWAIDCDYNLELFNNGYSQFCEQVLNFKPILKLKVPSLNSKLNWPDGYQEKMLSAYKLALSGCAHQIKIKVITGENERILSIHFYPIHSQKNTKAAILGVACFGEDVTVMENWQQAIEKQNNQLRDIAWTQSHLVRAPLAKIMGLVQLLQVELKDYNDVKQHLDFLDKSCSELDETIRSITQYTHPIKHPSK